MKTSVFSTLGAILTEKRNAFQANKEWLLPSSNAKYIKKKHTEEKAKELNNRFSVMEDPVSEQKTYDNQQLYMKVQHVY